MVPAALFFLAVRHSVGKRTRMRRIAGSAAIASVVAFCVYNLAAGQRRYLIEMLGALALFYYLRAAAAPRR